MPDAGFCQGVINGSTPGGGRKFLLICDGDDGGYILSLSANQAGTEITVQSMLNAQGQITCGSLFFGCATTDDCCIGFSCQDLDAGPTIGELRRCNYSWPE